MEILVIPFFILLLFVYVYIKIYLKGWIEVTFFRRITQNSIRNWIWILPCINYVDFFTTRGVYISWIQWDLICIEWRAL